MKTPRTNQSGEVRSNLISRQVMAAARELDCSDAYIHVRFKRAGLTLKKVLDAGDMEALLHGR